MYWAPVYYLLLHCFFLVSSASLMKAQRLFEVGIMGVLGLLCWIMNATLMIKERLVMYWAPVYFLWLHCFLLSNTSLMKVLCGIHSKRCFLLVAMNLECLTYDHEAACHALYWAARFISFYSATFTKFRVSINWELTGMPLFMWLVECAWLVFTAFLICEISDSSTESYV